MKPDEGVSRFEFVVSRFSSHLWRFTFYVLRFTFYVCHAATPQVTRMVADNDGLAIGARQVGNRFTFYVLRFTFYVLRFTFYVLRVFDGTRNVKRKTPNVLCAKRSLR
jgi:hypothetical protein